MTTIKWLLISTTALYLVTVLVLYFFQSQFLYFPRQAKKYELEHNFEFNNDGVTLRGWVVNPGRTTALIYYGGNAERIDFFLKDFSVLFSGHTIYFVNYRGYGESEGKPGQADLYADAVAIFDSVKQQHAAVDLLGKSLGSGIAVYVAAQRPVHKLALVTPYDSILNVAKSHYPIFPVSLMLHDQYQAASYAANISAPTLIVSAEHDQIIPAANTVALAAQIKPELLTLIEIKDTDHNSISAEESYYVTLINFFSQK